MKFRKKPVIIDAERYFGDSNFNLIRLFMGNDELIHHFGNRVLGIPTLEGMTKVNPGDWIIRGVKGEFHPIKNDIFLATYERVEE